MLVIPSIPSIPSIPFSFRLTVSRLFLLLHPRLLLLLLLLMLPDLRRSLSLYLRLLLLLLLYMRLQLLTLLHLRLLRRLLRFLHLRRRLFPDIRPLLEFLLPLLFQFTYLLLWARLIFLDSPRPVPFPMPVIFPALPVTLKLLLGDPFIVPSVSVPVLGPVK